MGVLACDKRGCDNIMCDTCVNGSYYICDECKEQFKLWLASQAPLYLDSQSFLYQKFEEFMKIEKEDSTIPENLSDIVDKFFLKKLNT